MHLVRRVDVELSALGRKSLLPLHQPGDLFSAAGCAQPAGMRSSAWEAAAAPRGRGFALAERFLLLAQGGSVSLELLLALGPPKARWLGKDLRR